MSNAAPIKQKLTAQMDQSIEHLKRDLAGLRTGRASVALLDGVRVDYYGTMTPLKQIANISTPEARLLTIQPWEPQLIKEIEKALANSGLGVTPSNDGKMIRVTDSPAADVLPVFSPDGKRLMWTSGRTEDRSSQLFIGDFKLPAE